MEVARRFVGIAHLYGDAALARFQQAHIVVIGVGGVGSWAVEGLARSGIGQLTLVDLDNVAESNINRQLPALDSTLGMAKVEVLRQRVADINPACKVTVIEDFITLDNIASLLAPATATDNTDFIVDCIDNARVKAALIAHCKRNKIKIISVGGAGGQCDPSKIRLGDLARSQQDPLLAKVRKHLRQQYGFSQNPKRRFEIACVWSDEQMMLPRQGEGTKSGLSCAGGIGSVMTVTATVALFAVSHVLSKLSA